MGTESTDPADPSFAQAQTLAAMRREVDNAIDNISFTWSSTPLQDSPLIHAFGATFEATVFASFELAGWTVDGQSRLRSLGDGTPPQIADPFAGRLLTSDAVRQHLPELATHETELGFYGVGPLLLEGSLAMALHEGGPYSQMPADEALHLATQFREALAGTRFDDLVVLTGSGWSPWFAQMGWDHGWIITDILDARTYLLCASGND